jgi:hypothetical protein
MPTLDTIPSLVNANRLRMTPIPQTHLSPRTAFLAVITALFAMPSLAALKLGDPSLISTHRRH